MIRGGHSCANTNTFCTLKINATYSTESVVMYSNLLSCTVCTIVFLSKKPRIGGNVRILSY
mgnify:FL=1